MKPLIGITAVTLIAALATTTIHGESSSAPSLYQQTLELTCDEIDAEYSRYMERGAPSFEAYLNWQEVQRLYELCIKEQAWE